MVLKSDQLNLNETIHVLYELSNLQIGSQILVSNLIKKIAYLVTPIYRQMINDR